MSDYRRYRIQGGTYFFAVNLQDRTQSLLVDHIDPFRAAYRSVAERHRFETLAIVVLPDHLHAIWRLPEGDADYSTRWRLIKSEFVLRIRPAREAKPRRPGERGVWQRRFWEHAVRDDAELAAYTDYIHWNPVKHGHVAELDDWPFSSWHRFKRDTGLEHDPKRWAAMQFGERDP